MDTPTGRVDTITERKANAITWRAFSFAELDIQLLYNIMRLRQQVFVVEQACVYQDLDNLDLHCWHLCGQRDGELLTYLRCLPPGLDYAESSLGRILVNPQARGLKLGAELVQRGIDHNLASWPASDIRIGAQAYLEGFYTNLGFVSASDVYDEDGIPHLKMLLRRH